MIRTKQEELRRQQLDNLLNISYCENNMSSINLVALSPDNRSVTSASFARSPRPNVVEYYNMDDSPVNKSRIPTSARRPISAQTPLSSRKSPPAPQTSDSLIDTYANKYYIDRAVITEIFHAARSPLIQDLAHSEASLTSEQVRLKSVYKKKLSEIETQFNQDLSSLELSSNNKTKKMASTIENLKSKLAKSESETKRFQLDLQDTLKRLECLNDRCKELTSENSTLISISERQLLLIQENQPRRKIIEPRIR